MKKVLKKIRDTLNKPVILESLRGKKMSTRLRLTSSGLGFLGLVLCGFLMSVNFSNNLIFAMTFLLISIALVGWYHTRINVSGLFIGDWKVQPVFAGQNAVYRLGVENLGGRRRHALLPRAKKSLEIDEVHLAGREKAELRLERSTRQRGVLAEVPADLCSCFPLGIFEARMVTGWLPKCLVYPAPAGSQPLPEHSAGSMAHLRAESGTYTDMRRYSPGDPLSRISWKAFARFDELYTREFDGGQGQPALWLRWEDVAAAGIEEKLSQLCSWALDAHRKKREFGLQLPGRRIEPGEGEEHLHHCLGALALYGTREEEEGESQRGWKAGLAGIYDIFKKKREGRA